MKNKRKLCLCLAIMTLCALLLGTFFAGTGMAAPGQTNAAQADNPHPPDRVVKLVFIHHSCGENWLADDHGGLGMALANNNYFVSDTNYGWGPDSIGDRTDILDWPEWFRGPNSGAYLNALYTLNDQNSYYTRPLADPGGENQIIMFKSCFPNSNLEGNPNDPPSTDDWLTVGSAKRVYNDLLEYFATRQDRLFVVITAPPVQDPTYAANARAFNNWLVYEWLAGYPYSNVAVFDFYNVLTTNGGHPDTNDLGRDSGNHHRYHDGAIQHIFDGDDDANPNVSEYPTDGDDHPSPAGNQKASGEFVPVLNVYYNRYLAAASGEAPPPPTAIPTPPPGETPPPPTAVPTPPPDEEGGKEQKQEKVAEPRAAGLIDDFEGTYGPYEGWSPYTDEQGDTTFEYRLDGEVYYNGATSLRMEYDIAPWGWCGCGRSYDSPQDWSGGTGLSMRLHGDRADQDLGVTLYVDGSGEPTPFEFWFEAPAESVDDWALVELPWEGFIKPDWAGGAGLSEFDPAQVVGIWFGFVAEEGRNTGTVWVDDIRLVGF